MEVFSASVCGKDRPAPSKGKNGTVREGEEEEGGTLFNQLLTTESQTRAAPATADVSQREPEPERQRTTPADVSATKADVADPATGHGRLLAIQARLTTGVSARPCAERRRPRAHARVCSVRV